MSDIEQPLRVTDRFTAAMKDIPKGLVPEAPTEFKNPAVSINQVMREVCGVLRDHGLLVQAQLVSVEPMEVLSRRYTDGDTGEIVKSTDRVIKFVFDMNITDFAGHRLWDGDRWVSFQRNLDQDRRPEFWGAKALSYAIKYWLCRRLGIDMGADNADDVDQEIVAAPPAPQPVPKKRPKPAAPKPDVELSQISWQGMFDLWQATLGEQRATEAWAGRRKTGDLMTVDQAEAANRMLTQLAQEVEQEQADPFPTSDETADAVRAEIGKAKAALAATTPPPDPFSKETT